MKAPKIKYKIIISLATICLSCFSAVAIAKDLHVPSEYNTIQAAIDAAFPMDTVIVAKGIYSESIAVKTGLKVIGAGKEVTTITNSSGDCIVKFDNASFRTEFSGFTIDGQGGNLKGIYATNKSSPNISDVAVKNVGGEGIYCQGDPTLSNVRIADTGSYGIDCQGSLTLSNAEIDRAGSNGIYCTSSSNFLDVTINNVKGPGIQSYADLSASNIAIVDTGNIGIQCNGKLTLSHTTISKAGGDGITCSSYSKISDVTINDVKGSGISCGNDSTISNATIDEAGSYGIKCGGNSSISNVTIDKTGNRGINCGQNSTIDNATISDAGDDGIYVGYSSNISNCEITRSGGDGIECYGYSGATKVTKIRKCIVVQNLQNGIYVKGDKDINLGTISDPGQNEIYYNAKFDVFNETNSKIKALGNWWGQAPPNPQFLSGEVDYGQWLTEPPLSGAQVDSSDAIPQNVLSQLETERGKRWAVLIGVNRYQDTKLSSLKFAVNDVKDVYSTLTDPQVGSFDKERIHLLIEDSEQTSTLGEAVLKEPTFPNIWDSLNSVVKTAQPADTVLIYFSGHGIEEGDQTWLLASDSRLSMLDRTAIPLDEVNRVLSECQADSKILILDACHSGAVKDKGGYGTMTSDFKDTAFTAVAGKATLSSSGLNESSYDYDEKRHSAFTYFLLEGLKGKADSNADNIVTLMEIGDYVKTEVPKWGFKSGKQQTPIFNSYITGEVILTGCSGQ